MEPTVWRGSRRLSATCHLPRILDHFRELFERGTADGGAVQGLQLGGIGDQLDFCAQALRFKV
jgi:hypothetical protein